MLRYLLPDLPPARMRELQDLQDRVDAEATLEQKVTAATAIFSRKTPKAAFDAVKEQLRAAAPAGGACFYCERDRLREIEHVRPKRFYPEHCFKWSNYVYACTICNQDSKRDRYAVFADTTDEVFSFDRRRDYADGTPTGDHVLIDIRAEDPLDFLRLDFETGGFAPLADQGRNRRRAEFTRDLFELDADDLRLIRLQAYKSFKTYLIELQIALQAQDDERVDRVVEEIQNLPFPTVLVEMRRQAGALPELTPLFEGVPDSIGQRP
jgi:uncharacterized protein (TIGR02646 family)